MTTTDQQLKERMSEIAPGDWALTGGMNDHGGPLRESVSTMLSIACALLDDATEPGTRVAVDLAVELLDAAVWQLTSYRDRLDALRSQVELEALIAEGYKDADGNWTDKAEQTNPRPVEQR
jgi:hypothetical protein